jgi:type I restriction enzyme, R subunit
MSPVREEVSFTKGRIIVRGKLVTESLRNFTKKALRKRFASLDDFLHRWSETDRKQAIVDELGEEWFPLDPLAKEVGKNLDSFDLICHVVFDLPPLMRRERVENVRKRDVFTKYGSQARAVLDALLAKYQDEGVLNLDDPRIRQTPPFSTPILSSLFISAYALSYFQYNC